MSAASEISEFMVAAGAFVVGGTLRTDTEAKRLAARMAPLKRAMTSGHDRAVARAVAALAKDGVSQKGIDRLNTALAGRMAAIAAEREAADAARKQTAMTARLPYADN